MLTSTEDNAIIVHVESARRKEGRNDLFRDISPRKIKSEHGGVLEEPYKCTESVQSELGNWFSLTGCLRKPREYCRSVPELNERKDKSQSTDSTIAEA